MAKGERRTASSSEVRGGELPSGPLEIADHTQILEWIIRQKRDLNETTIDHSAEAVLR